MLILAELKKKDRVWEQFVYELSNSHLQSSLGNELGEPCIPDFVDKASSANIYVHQNSPPHEPAVKNCKKIGPSHTKKSPVSKGQGVSSQSGGEKGHENLFASPNRRFTCSMTVKERKKGNPKVKSLYMLNCHHPMLPLPMITLILLVLLIILQCQVLSVNLCCQHPLQNQV